MAPQNVTNLPHLPAPSIRVLLQDSEFLKPVKKLPEDETSCSICKEPYHDEGHIAVKTVCHHIFGKSCLAEWMDIGQETFGTCPICRHVLWGLPPSPWRPMYRLYMVADSTRDRLRRLTVDGLEFGRSNNIALARLQAVEDLAADHLAPPEVPGRNHAQLTRQFRDAGRQVTGEFHVAGHRHDRASEVEEEGLAEFLILSESGRADAERRVLDRWGRRGMGAQVVDYEFARKYRQSAEEHFQHVLADIDTLEKWSRGEFVPEPNWQPVCTLFRYPQYTLARPQPREVIDITSPTYLEFRAAHPELNLPSREEMFPEHDPENPWNPRAED